MGLDIEYPMRVKLVSMDVERGFITFERQDWKKGNHGRRIYPQGSGFCRE